jgi:hypothetical protein
MSAPTTREGQKIRVSRITRGLASLRQIRDTNLHARLLVGTVWETGKAFSSSWSSMLRHTTEKDGPYIFGLAGVASPFM